MSLFIFIIHYPSEKNYYGSIPTFIIVMKNIKFKLIWQVISAAIYFGVSVFSVKTYFLKRTKVIEESFL